MIVAGYEVPQEAVRAVTKRIRAQMDPFLAADVAEWFRQADGAVNAKTEWDKGLVLYQATARLLQFERNAGHIVYKRMAWQVRHPVAEGDVIERGLVR